MAMTLRDNGKSDIGLLGPSNLPQFIHATRFFLFHESLKSDCTEFTGKEGEKYEDENLTIWPVLLSGQCFFIIYKIRNNYTVSHKATLKAEHVGNRGEGRGQEGYEVTVREV